MSKQKKKTLQKEMSHWKFLNREWYDQIVL